MKELYNTMPQDNLLTTSKAITPPPPRQLTENKATRGILGVCTLLLCLVMGACGSSEDADDAKPTKSDNTTPDKDKEETVTVTFDLNYTGATDTPSAQTIKKGSKAKVPTEPTRTKYKLTNWYTDQATTKTFVFTTPITADITLYAKWTAIITYTVTFDLNGGTGTAPDPQTVKKDDNATKPTDPTRDGYTFDNWYTDAVTKNVFAFGTIPITTDITLYAKWIQIDCREARKSLTHKVALYKDGETDAPYLPKVLRGEFADEDKLLATLYWNKPKIPAGKEDELPYIYPSVNNNLDLTTGGFDITLDHIDASIKSVGTITVRISCYSVKKVNDNLYFYYGKVRFLVNGQETEENNKVMYAFTGIDKRDDANKDALYGYMVSIQGNHLRPLRIYPFVGGKYTRAATGTEGTADYVPEKIVTFPKTEADYAALTLEDLNIIATAPLTSDDLFEVFPGNRRPSIYRGPNN